VVTADRAGMLVGSGKGSKHRAVTARTVVAESSLTEEVDATLDHRCAGEKRARLERGAECRTDWRTPFGCTAAVLPIAAAARRQRPIRGRENGRCQQKAEDYRQ